MPAEGGLTTKTRPDAAAASLPAGPVPAEGGLTTMQPLYTPDNTKAAYELNWGLTVFWRTTPVPDSLWLAALQQATEADGVRIIKHAWTTGDASQFFISTKPHVPPQELIRSVKGRLQHEIGSLRPQGVSTQLLPARHRCCHA